MRLFRRLGLVILLILMTVSCRTRINPIEKKKKMGKRVAFSVIIPEDQYALSIAPFSGILN
jgi:hypothetical protein